MRRSFGNTLLNRFCILLLGCMLVVLCACQETGTGKTESSESLTIAEVITTGETFVEETQHKSESKSELNETVEETTAETEPEPANKSEYITQLIKKPSTLQLRYAIDRDRLMELIEQSGIDKLERLLTYGNLELSLSVHRKNNEQSKGELSLCYRIGLPITMKLIEWEQTPQGMRIDAKRLVQFASVILGREDLVKMAEYFGLSVTYEELEQLMEVSLTKEEADCLLPYLRYYESGVWEPWIERTLDVLFLDKESQQLGEPTDRQWNIPVDEAFMAEALAAFYMETTREDVDGWVDATIRDQRDFIAYAREHFPKQAQPFVSLLEEEYQKREPETKQKADAWCELLKEAKKELTSEKREAVLKALAKEMGSFAKKKMTLSLQPGAVLFTDVDASGREIFRLSWQREDE